MKATVNPKKLTPGEIKSIVDKIRKKYDEYTYKYFKPKTLKDAFEDRYIKALRSSVDVSAFFLAEISAIEELIELGAVVSPTVTPAVPPTTTSTPAPPVPSRTVLVSRAEGELLVKVVENIIAFKDDFPIEFISSSSDANSWSSGTCSIARSASVL